jgi:hypothetical protein
MVDAGELGSAVHGVSDAGASDASNAAPGNGAPGGADRADVVIELDEVDDTVPTA